MYFTPEEVKLIRDAAKAMPIRGFQDPGKAQVSWLADCADIGTADAVVMAIDGKQNEGKLTRDAAERLSSLVRGVALTPHERWRLPDDENLRTRAEQTKRATALKYVNRLRESQRRPRPPDRPGGDRRSRQRQGGRSR